MASLPTLPRRSWLERGSLTLALALTVTGVGTLAGWWLHLDELLQPVADRAVLKVNGALGFAVLGFVLMAIEFGRRRLAALALVPAAIGVLTLVEILFRRNFQLDELLARDHLLILTEQPGRMSAMVATCLVLAGIALTWRTFDRGAHARLFAEAVIGSVLAAAGVSTLLGYGVDMRAVYSWGTATATSPVAAVALLLLGLALILLAWRESVKETGGWPAWSPMPAVIGCLTLTVILSVGLRERERTYVQQKTQNAAESLAVAIHGGLDQQLNLLERLARRFGDNPQDSTDLRRDDAAQLLGRLFIFAAYVIDGST